MVTGRNRLGSGHEEIARRIRGDVHREEVEAVEGTDAVQLHLVSQSVDASDRIRAFAVKDIDIRVRVDGHSYRIGSGKDRGLVLIGVDFDYPVVAGIGNVDIVCRIDRDTLGRIEPRRGDDARYVLGTEQQNTVVARVCQVDDIVRPHSDLTRVIQPSRGQALKWNRTGRPIFGIVLSQLIIPGIRDEEISIGIHCQTIRPGQTGDCKHCRNSGQVVLHHSAAGGIRKIDISCGVDGHSIGSSSVRERLEPFAAQEGQRRIRDRKIQHLRPALQIELLAAAVSN